MTLKIVYVASERLPVPPVKGGATETWIFEVARRVRMGQRFVLSFYDPELERFKDDSGVSWRAYKPGLAARCLLKLKRSLFGDLSSPFYFLPYSFWVAREARKIGADIIHLHTRPQFVPLLRMLNPRAKLILHFHMTASLERGNGFWPARFFRGVDVVVACSEFLKQEIGKAYPLLRERTVVLYNGVNLADFRPDDIRRKEVRRELEIGDDETVVIYSGRVVMAKGVHVLVGAFRDAAAKYPKTRLLVLGGVMYSDNRETPYIRQMKESCFDLGSRVKFLGYIAHNRVPDFLNAADILVVPTLCDEAFGLVIIEGLASRKCVVAFNKGGIREILKNGENGVLLEDARTEPLREALVDLYEDVSKRQSLAQRAFERVGECFSWERIVADVEAFYRRLMNTSIGDR